MILDTDMDTEVYEYSHIKEWRRYFRQCTDVHGTDVTDMFKSTLTVYSVVTLAETKLFLKLYCHMFC